MDGAATRQNASTTSAFWHECCTRVLLMFADNHCAINRSIDVQRHGVNQFLASGNIDGTFKQTAGCFRQDNSYHCVRSAADDVPGRMRVLTRTRSLLHANKTLINRIDLATPAFIVLSTGYRPLGSCSRAAGWSAATSCIGPTPTSCRVCTCVPWWG